MSMKELGFALDQHQLEPNEQLALIIISDAFYQYFTRGDAIRSVMNRTSLTQDESREIVDALLDKQIIGTYKRSTDKAGDVSCFIRIEQS